MNSNSIFHEIVSKINYRDCILPFIFDIITKRGISMAKKTKDQLESELKAAQGQVQELLLEIGKLKQANIES